MKSLLYIAVLAWTPIAAGAQASREYYQNAGWLVSLDYGQGNEESYCVAHVRNPAGQALSIGLTVSDPPLLSIHDPSWNLGGHESGIRTRFLVDVDYSRWTMNGQAAVRSVYIEVNNDFIGQIGAVRPMRTRLAFGR